MSDIDLPFTTLESSDKRILFPNSTLYRGSPKRQWSLLVQTCSSRKRLGVVDVVAAQQADTQMGLNPYLCLT